jgi:hypothetical protein
MSNLNEIQDLSLEVKTKKVPKAKAKKRGRAALPAKTKLGALLEKRDISQSQLLRMIEKKTGLKWDRCRISQIVTGAKKNILLSTAQTVAKTLGVKVDDITEDITAKSE